jgi:antitoxin component YwqK of YwqJK toxin-antitoxin module
VEWKKGKWDGDAVFYYDNGKVQSKENIRKDSK